MNTSLNNLYLKLCRIDSRYIRLALVFITLVASGGVVLGIPIHGDVGG
jgi:hypothetical protein